MLFIITISLLLKLQFSTQLFVKSKQILMSLKWKFVMKLTERILWIQYTYLYLGKGKVQSSIEMKYLAILNN